MQRAVAHEKKELRKETVRGYMKRRIQVEGDVESMH